MEEWKQIINYPKYSCSNFGKIKNMETNKILSQRLKNGYYVTSIMKKVFFVHQLITQTWIPNPEKKPTVNHINKIRTDNGIENLEWATALEINKLDPPPEDIFICVHRVKENPHMVLIGNMMK